MRLTLIATPLQLLHLTQNFPRTPLAKELFVVFLALLPKTILL